MIETKSHACAWSKSWIEFKAPDAEGVYWLRNKRVATAPVLCRGPLL